MAHAPTNPEEFSAHVATNIRMQMGGQRVTLRALGEATGISYSTLSRMTNGERDIPLGHLFKIAAALNVDPRDLINEQKAGK